MLSGAGLWLAAVFNRGWPVQRLPAFRGDVAIDAVVYTLAGDLWWRGGTPYVSYWDHKPPLVHLLNGAGFALAGAPGVWALSFAALLAALVFLYYGLCGAAGRVGAVVGVAYFACALPSVMAPALTEWYALPLQCAAVLVVVRGTREASRSLWWGVAAGVLAGLGFLLRPNLLGAGVVAGGGLASAALARGDRRGGARVVVGVVLGGAAVGAPTVAGLAMSGALAAFVDQVFRYNAQYAGAGIVSRIGAMIYGVQQAGRLTSLVLPAAGWLLAAHLLRSRGHRDPSLPVTVMAVVWVVVELGLAALSGRAYGHYFHSLLPPLSLLAALAGAGIASAGIASAGLGPSERHGRGMAQSPGGDAVIARSLGPRTPPRVWLGPTTQPGRLLCGGAVAGMLVSAGLDFVQAVRRGEGMKDRRQAQVDATVRYIRQHTPENGRVFVWGHAADVYLLSRRRPATRFIYPQPLLTPGYADSALVDGLLEELGRSAPAVIVDATGHSFDGDDLTPPLGRWNPAWRFPAVGSSERVGRAWWSMTPALASYYGWVAAHYTPADTVGPARWVMYRRRPAATAACTP